MTLSEELKWRGLIEQTTFKDIKAIDKGSITFYWGVDPSADSMTVGNLAAAMLVKHFIKAGHKAVLLIGGATGLIGDPDGKASERQLQTLDQIDKNKKAIINQYKDIFKGENFEIVDNFNWFNNMSYLEFLRDIGKHIPMRHMLGREFIDTRLGEGGSGISYAEFSYVLIQAYDFLHLFKTKNVTLQLSGSDQWGNAIAGVDLVRRITSKSVDVLTQPLVVDRTTGRKFGKSEKGAIWLDPKKTSPTAFYQFWINMPDEDIEGYLKIYTFLNKKELDKLIADHKKEPQKRLAQKKLSLETTKLVHGEKAANLAISVTEYLIGHKSITEANKQELKAISTEIPVIKLSDDKDLIKALVDSQLASSNTEARKLISSGAISLDGKTLANTNLEDLKITGKRHLIRRGKAFRDSAIIES